MTETTAPETDDTASDGDTAPYPPHHGRIIIEWPPLRPGAKPLTGWACTIYDADTSKPVTTAEKMNIPAVLADAKGYITAYLTMFTDENGAPLLDGAPHLNDGAIVMGMFPFLVTEMRVRQ